MKRMNYIVVLLLALVSCLNASSQDLFHKDWTWKYEREDMFQDTYYRFSMAFGDEVEANGHIWHEFKTISSQCCIRDYNTGEWYEENYFDLPCVKCYYVREEDGKWYVLCNNEGFDIEYKEQFQNTEEFSEKLIYDFNCQAGESFVALEFETQCDVEVEVKENFTVKVDGIDRRCITYSYDNFYVVEGIGPFVGVLTGLKNMFLAGWGDHIYNYMPAHGFAPFLKDVVDNSGKSILDGIVYPQVGIGLTPHDEKETNPKVYDLFGREIVNPVPGSVYIKSGRKYIFRQK